MTLNYSSTSFLMRFSVAFALMVSGGAANAQSVNGTLVVTATIPASCTINTVGNALIDFGTVALSTPPVALDGNTTIPLVFTCTADSTTATFTINAGVNDSGGTHRLRNPAVAGTAAEFLIYKIYPTAARTAATEYTIGTPRSINGGIVTAGVATTVPLFARIVATENAKSLAGSYTDTVLGVITL